tara:strand:- start:3361 stop:6231 length:2871 start_codon:yes stop_codon:yes gene_type:complete
MRFFKILILLFITNNIIFSATVTEQSALNIAENFFYSKNDSRITSFNYEDIETISLNNEDIFHAVKLSPNGFILVSADNLIMPILGYSFENNFINENMPSNVLYLFNLYGRELNELKTNNTEYRYIEDEWNKFSMPVDYEPSNRNVSPLLQSRFNQDNPWNAMCPEDSQGPGGNAYAGCVAVSMAAIMHYWSFPTTGVGERTYWASGYGYQTADFSSAYYDYNSMPNYTSSTETQELLYHCGVAVNMGYNYDGSGAQVFGSAPSAYHAMRNHFLYDSQISSVDAGSYSASQYRSILQDDLNQNQPIIYVGYSDDGGHAWNIDGYSDDYFHNNWGWGGSQNGYYLLSALNGFDYSQGAIVNMIPESLESANVVMQDFSFEEQVGDGDLVANPGETINLYVTLENLIPWNNSSSTDLILTTEDPDLNIINEYVSFNYLASGNSFTNSQNPFIVEFSNDINFAPHEMLLTVVSTSTTGDSDVNTYYINVDVSIQQSGFPYNLTLSGEEVTTVVQSSPNIYDIDNDGYSEIFFGDNNGYLHGLNYLGNNLNGFPVELPDGTSKEIWGSPAIADIDNDGEIEIVITSKNKHCYIIDENGNIELNYETEQFLMGTPSLANLDNDNFLEIIFTGYTTSGDIFAINHDGSDVNNFPVSIDEKILRGVAIHDINGNGKDDIVVATENEKIIAIVYDNGTQDIIFESENKFKSAPSIIQKNDEILIVVGDEDGHFYGMDQNGNMIFDFITGDNIRSEAGFINHNNQLKIFIGSEDGKLYGLDENGNQLENWPVDIGNFKVNSSPIFADIDNNGIPEVISGTEEGHLIIVQIDGTPFSYYPMQMNNGFISSPTIIDLDNDNDLEIVVGTNANLSIFDLKESGTIEDYYWNAYRGDSHNTGSFIFESSGTIGDLNSDGIIDVLDLVTTINIIMDVLEPTSIQLFSGDINVDGNIDVLDVVQLVNIILD